jgi:hypothetical protein
MCLPQRNQLEHHDQEAGHSHNGSEQSHDSDSLQVPSIRQHETNPDGHPNHERGNFRNAIRHLNGAYPLQV